MSQEVDDVLLVGAAEHVQLLARVRQLVHHQALDIAEAVNDILLNLSCLKFADHALDVIILPL